MQGVELAYAIMGLTAGCLLGLWLGVSVEKTRTVELRRVFRQRLRRLQRPPVRENESAASIEEPPAFGDEGGAGFGIVG